MILLVPIPLHCLFLFHQPVIHYCPPSILCNERSLPQILSGSVSRQSCRWLRMPHVLLHQTGFSDNPSGNSLFRSAHFLDATWSTSYKRGGGLSPVSNHKREIWNSKRLKHWRQKFVHTISRHGRLHGCFEDNPPIQPIHIVRARRPVCSLTSTSTAFAIDSKQLQPRHQLVWSSTMSLHWRTMSTYAGVFKTLPNIRSVRQITNYR